jgi:hypothetical protein
MAQENTKVAARNPYVTPKQQQTESKKERPKTWQLAAATVSGGTTV